MKPLYGQDAFGEWRLEIWDNRLGAGVSNSVLLGWELNLAFARSNAPTTLMTNGMTSTNAIGAGGFAYYLFSLPCDDSQSTNILVDASSPVDVWLNNRVPPTGSAPDDILIAAGVTSGVFLFQAGVAPLTGRDYYLGLRSAAGATNLVTFSGGWSSPCRGSATLSWSLSAASSGMTPSGYKLAWSGPAGHTFVVEYTDTLPAKWAPVSKPVTSADGAYSFTDDTAATTLASPTRFYRIREL